MARYGRFVYFIRVYVKRRVSHYAYKRTGVTNGNTANDMQICRRFRVFRSSAKILNVYVFLYGAYVGKKIICVICGVMIIFVKLFVLCDAVKLFFYDLTVFVMC